MSIEQIRNVLADLKSKGNPDAITAYFKRIEGEYLPVDLLLDKARAIQLSNGREYGLEVTEEILKGIIKENPECISAYVELGYFYDAVMDNTENAISIFSDGVKMAEQLLREVYLGHAKALVNGGHLKDACQEAIRFRNEDPRFKSLLSEIEEDLDSE